jgi:hypothetical protein
MIVSMDYPGVHKTYNQVCFRDIYVWILTVIVYSSVEYDGIISAGWCCSEMAAYCGGNWNKNKIIILTIFYWV